MSVALAFMLLVGPTIGEGTDDAFPGGRVSTIVAAEEAVPAAEPQSTVPPATAEQLPPATPPPAPPSELPGVIEQGDIVVVGRPRVDRDPLVGINAPSFAVTQKIDDALVGPLANAYAKTLPTPIRSGIHNFLSNLHEPVIFLNYLLQIKPGKAMETLGRFAINTTLGAAGLFDVAKRRPFKLPFRPNGFGDTLGFYGVKPGPFLFLPIIGASTPRDLVGLILDRLVLPVAVGPPFGRPAYAIPTGILYTLDRRVEFDPDLRRTREEDDPYVARRELYLKARQAEIDALHGKHPARAP